MCADACSGGGTYDETSSCGRICNTAPLGPFGSASGSVGSTGTCYTNSTYCPGGTYTVIRNSYSSVNFDCNSCCGCGPYGGCCVPIGSPSAPDISCISCHY